MSQHDDEACHGHNSIAYQSYEDLEKLICDKQGQNYRRSLQDDKITFFEDNDNQMLLVQKLLNKQQRLMIITMKQNEKFKNLKDMDTCSENNHTKMFGIEKLDRKMSNGRQAKTTNNSIIECLH